MTSGEDNHPRPPDSELLKLKRMPMIGVAGAGFCCCNVAIGWEGCLVNGAPQGPIYGQKKKERLATGFWNRMESNQATDCNSLVSINVSAGAVDLQEAVFSHGFGVHQWNMSLETLLTLTDLRSSADLQKHQADC